MSLVDDVYNCRMQAAHPLLLKIRTEMEEKKKEVDYNQDIELGLTMGEEIIDKYLNGGV